MKLNNLKKILKLLIILVFLSSLSTTAQVGNINDYSSGGGGGGGWGNDTNTSAGGSLNDVIINIALLIQNLLIPIVIALALLVFLWGVMKYGTSRDDQSRKESIAIIINGIIILFVMVSVWGLVWLFASFFNVNISNPTTLPDKQIQSGDLIIR
jgi:quinol-cytochrome oxidoreductase complex cytochrome b subunit